MWPNVRRPVPLKGEHPVCTFPVMSFVTLEHILLHPVHLAEIIFSDMFSENLVQEYLYGSFFGHSSKVFHRVSNI